MTDSPDQIVTLPTIDQAPPPRLNGANVTPIYTSRKMTMYALTESEVSTISQLNADVSTNFSIATFLISIGVSVYVNSIFYDQLNAAGSLAKGFVAPIIMIIGLTFAGRGFLDLRRRSNLWAKLKAESAVESK